MPFKPGEYVRCKSGKWYGQVSSIMANGQYRVRIGGTDVTQDVPEGDLEFQLGRSIAPSIFPPIQALKGSISLPTLSYPFSNEPGFAENSNFWGNLGAIQPGAVVGVSGSVFDLAGHARQSCRQIVSTDINSCTTSYVDRLRRIVILLGNVGIITRTKTHWRSKEVTILGPMGQAEFFKDAIDLITKPNCSPDELFVDCRFQNGGPALALRTEFEAMDKSMKTTVTGYSSWWYKHDYNISWFYGLIAQGQVKLLCGDLSDATNLNAIKLSLNYPITIFNISNALDYISNLDPIIAMFESCSHTASAKVISSSQSLVEKCKQYLGTFQNPGIKSWDEFIVILKSLKQEQLAGSLR